MTFSLDSDIQVSCDSCDAANSNRTPNSNNSLFHTYWDLQIELICWKPGSKILAANDNSETTFSHMGNPFCPIRKRLSKRINISNELGSFVDGASFFTALNFSLAGISSFSQDTSSRVYATNFLITLLVIQTINWKRSFLQVMTTHAIT